MDLTNLWEQLNNLIQQTSTQVDHYGGAFFNTVSHEFTNLIQQASTQVDYCRLAILNTVLHEAPKFKYPQVRRDESVTYTSFGVEVCRN